MYVYVSAVVLPRTIGSQYINEDISSLLVEDIYLNFKEIYLTLQKTVNSQITNIYIDFNANKEYAQYYKGTLVQFLSSIANIDFITIESLPNTNIAIAKYSDAFYAGYGINIDKFNPADSVYKDLAITRSSPITDSTLIDKYCLVTVNGYLHRTASLDNKTFILDGATTMGISNNNQVGILSFIDIGEVKKIRILEDWIVSVDEATPIKTKFYLNVPKNIIDFTNKTIMLSLGGYLVTIAPNIFWQSGEQVLTINLNTFPILERYFESSKYLSMNSLGLTLDPTKPGTIDVSEFFSDAVLKKYLTLSQSFIIVIDNANIKTERFPVQNSKLPGLYISYTEPLYPLFLGYGKMPEYWRTYEDKQWSLSVEDGFMRNYIFSTTELSSVLEANGATVPFDPHSYSEAYFLQISGIKQ